MHHYAELRVSLALAQPHERAGLYPKIIAAWEAVEREVNALACVPVHVCP